MNQDIEKSRQKSEAVRRMVESFRMALSANDQMDEAVAGLFGINRTDGRCLGLIERRKQLTAGELARLSGLTTGAVTTVLDRLEKAGYVRRVHDPDDRRKVLIELTEQAKIYNEAIYSSVSAVNRDSLRGMSIEDLDVIGRFLRANASLHAALSDLMRACSSSKPQSQDERQHITEDYARRASDEHDQLVAEFREIWLGRNDGEIDA